jgi:2-dehydro-3-deoxygalactonokinase
LYFGNAFLLKETQLIAIDWGTSSLRAYRLDARGNAADKREAPLGIMQVKGGAFAQALESVVGDWLAAGEERVFMSGMIGSRQGWAETTYVECPASEHELVRNTVTVTWGARRAVIVPGLRYRDASGAADVLRGEETQILGALADLGDGEHLICLPGTHSKWVEVRNRRFVSFATYMTGELYALLKQQSILSRMMGGAPTDTDVASAYFERGVERARSEGGVLRHLFGVRAEVLVGDLPEAESANYLSGLLIGEEILSADPSGRNVVLIGSAALCARYTRALAILGLRSRTLNEDVAHRGLWRIATSRAGLRG